MPDGMCNGKGVIRHPRPRAPKLRITPFLQSPIMEIPELSLPFHMQSGMTTGENESSEKGRLR